MAGKIVDVLCDHCHTSFPARLSDRKRGWARFCGKSCKAKHQERRTGAYSDYLNRKEAREISGFDPNLDGDDDDRSWDAHKSWT